MQPIVHEQLTHVLCQHFGAQPKQGAELATKLIKTLALYDLQIIRGEWTRAEEQPRGGSEPRGKIYVNRKEARWQELLEDAEEWINSPASPLNRSELR